MEDTEKKTQVRFPFEVWQDMKRLAKEHGRSFNGEIVWALRSFIASQKGDKDTHDAPQKL